MNTDDSAPLAVARVVLTRAHVSLVAIHNTCHHSELVLLVRRVRPQHDADDRPRLIRNGAVRRHRDSRIQHARKLPHERRALVERHARRDHLRKKSSECRLLSHARLKKWRAPLRITAPWPELSHRVDFQMSFSRSRLIGRTPGS
jgi:hypothetical protein